jgi:glycine/D-amino acid oxidase-like deaminating enzyme
MPELECDTTTDVCIVGGGYTGLWTALALKERDSSLHVVLVEAETCGAGPSGRNGGFLHGYWAGLADLLPLLGRERALQLARAGERIVPAVRAFCESRGEDVWLRESGLLMVSASPSQDDAVDRAVAAAAEVAAGEQAVPLDANGVAARIRPRFFGAASTFRTGRPCSRRASCKHCAAPSSTPASSCTRIRRRSESRTDGSRRREAAFAPPRSWWRSTLRRPDGGRLRAT